MTVKAIISDLDRTLLHTDKSVSKRTLGVLEECGKRGIRIFAATARPTRNVTKYDQMIDFDAFSALNGAAVLLPDSSTECPIPRESAQSIVSELVHIPESIISMETSDGFFADADIPMWNPIIYDGFPSLPTQGKIYKILISSRTSDIFDRVASLLPEDTYCTLANGDIVQIMSKNATKLNGIRTMLDSFGISVDETVYFGDDHDDIEPIRACGVGVAVANAIPDVISVADAVTSSNDDDGVAEYIEKFIL